MKKTKNKQATAPKKLQGVVVSLGSINTIKVKVESKFAHPLYGKIVTTHKNYLVHCEDKNVVVGDVIIISEGRPVSKMKKFYFVKKIER